MTSNKLNYNPHLTKHIVEKELLGKEDIFFLIDVGASGGIESYWESFGSYLHGVGFDPLVNECKRLNSVNKNPNFSYYPSYIVSEDKEMDQYRTPETLKFHEAATMYARSSGWDATKRLKMDYIKEIFNKNDEVTCSTNKISIDRYCLENSISGVNFIKIDTDGFDYSVLRGAEKVVQDPNMLGVFIECDMNAPVHQHSNSFRNIDCFLSSLGYRLFDLSVWRYTKSTLPGKFVYEIPAQTNSGQVSWGDALYFRDFVDMKDKGEEPSHSQILKMACLLEIFGLPDCAAELLIASREKLSSNIDIDKCLDLLAKDMNLYDSYKTHMTSFERNPKNFFPTKSSEYSQKESLFQKIKKALRNRS